jgi:hypothetical protein
MKYMLVLAWAWLIILGALMITPGGVQCLVCGVLVTKVLGLFSIIVGISAFAINQRVAQR